MMVGKAEAAQFDYVVLGAGVAGLAFAYQMQSKGFSVLVLERDAQIGGLSKTLNHKSFLLDYSAHRFHSANPRVMAHVKELMGSNFQRYTQKSRIFMFGRYLKYPFELQNLLRAMPVRDAVVSGFDFAWNMVSRHLRGRAKPTDYRSWFINHFGKRLYKVMCEPYTSKIWKGNPELLSADWADQRFQGVNLKKLMKRVFQKLLRFDFSSYSLDDEKLAPDGGEFYYPEKGIQQICDRYAESIESKNGKVVARAEVFKVDVTSRTVSYRESNGTVVEIGYRKSLVSTIPLHTLYFALGNKNTQIEKDLKELNYMHIIFVYLFLNKEKVSNDHWLYFPDQEIVFNRSVEFKTWSEKMAPPDKTALCLDITCFENDAVWKATDEELTKQCIAGAEKVGLIQSHEAYESLVVRVKNAYPYYDLDYRRKLTNIVKHCEQAGDVFCLGRTGIFKYNNSDGSIEMALELADRLQEAQHNAAQDNNPSMLDYNFEHISY